MLSSLNIQEEYVLKETLDALHTWKGNRSAAARAIGITYDGIAARIRKYTKKGYIFPESSMERFYPPKSTHCAYGHAWDEKNTRYTKEGWRKCRRCNYLHKKRREPPTGERRPKYKTEKQKKEFSLASDSQYLYFGS